VTAAALHLLPFALDGESASNGSTGLAVISLVSIVFGYVLIAALWHFVFRPRAREKRKRPRGPQ
jgi:hypothetical protein